MEAAWGTIAGSGWASGVNLYAAVLMLGFLGRLGWEQVPEVLTRTDVLIGAGVLFAIEFVADKIPYVDNLWDAVHTVVRPVGAAGVGALLTGELAPGQELLGASSSGLLALASHVTKATARAAINTSPEPASNIVTSLVEDGMVAAVIFFAVANPVVAGILVLVLVVLGGLLTFFLWRTARRGLQRLRARRRVRTSP